MAENSNEELEKGKRLLREQAEEASLLDNAFKSIAASMKAAFEEVLDNLEGVDKVGAKIAKSYERDIVSSIRKMSTGLESNLELQLKINKGQNVAKEIAEQRNKVETRFELTKAKIDKAEGLSKKKKDSLIAALKEQQQIELDNLNGLEAQNKERQANKSITEVINENLKEYADTLDQTGTLSAILSGNLKEVMTDAKIVELAFMIIAKSTLEANKSITGIQKSLGVGSFKALGMRMELSAAAFVADDLRVTTETLINAQSELNNEFQTAAIFSSEIAKGAASALDAQLMSGAAVAQLAGDAARLGLSFDEALKSQEKAVNAVNKQTGAQINLKTVLEASNKITGQIRAQLGANPEAIARAVTQAKALGFELEQIANAGSQLLQFEQSIGAELEAELLTGKQLNLERARLAALTGDYETLTAEIAANVGDFNDFSKMNVLQQQAIASAVGMTADQLANSLITEENRAQLLQDAIASGDEQQVQNLKALDTQEKFAKVMMQIKGLFIDVFQVLSPIADLVGLVAEGLNGWFGKLVMVAGIMVGLYKSYKALKTISLATTISEIFKGNAKFGPLGIAASIAGVAALMGAISRFSKADDMYGDMTLVTKKPFGAIALNNRDQFAAGPGIADALNGGNGGGMSRGDLDYLISGINSKKVQFDSYSASGPQAIVNTERRRPTDLFF